MLYSPGSIFSKTQLSEAEAKYWESTTSSFVLIKSIINGYFFWIGLKNIFIETGSGKFFEPARKLFESCGFEECEPFGHYKNDPNSCYMKIKVWFLNF